MAQEVQSILIKYEADIKALRKDLDGAKKELKDFEKEGGKTGKALTNGFKGVGLAIAAAFSVQQVIAFGKELNDLQKEAQGVRQAFNAAFDPGALQRLRDTTKGTLSDLELMKRALAAREFGIGPDLLAKGLEFARVQANKLGLEFDFLAESFVTGAGRKSIQILDNLGISQADLSAKVKETGDFYTALGAIIDEKLGQDGAASVETLADRQNRLNAQIQNLRLRISDGLLPVFESLTSAALRFLDVLTNENSALENQRDQLNLLVAEITNAKEGTEERAAAVAELQRQYPNFLKNLDSERLTNKDLVEQLALANKEYTQRLALAEAGEELAERQARVSRLLADQQREVAEATVESNKAIAEFGLSIDEGLTGVDRVTAVQNELRKLFDTTEGAERAFRNIADARGFLGPVTEDLAEAERELAEETEIYNQIAEGLNIQLTQNTEELNNNTQATKGLTDATKESGFALTDFSAAYRQALEDAIAFRRDFEALDDGFLFNTSNLDAAWTDYRAELLDKFDQLRGDIEDFNEDAEDLRVLGMPPEQFNAQLEGARDSALDAYSSIAMGFSQVSGDLTGLIGAEAERSKSLATFQILLSQSVALARSIEAAATLKFPANIAAIVSSIAAITGFFAQVKALNNQAQVPAFAEGTSSAPGGMSLVGEEGPELMYVPKGARIFTSDATKRERGLIDAINAGKAGAFIEETYVNPALSTFAENISRSATQQLSSDELFYIRQAIKANKTVELGPKTRRLFKAQQPRFH